MLIIKILRILTCFLVIFSSPAHSKGAPFSKSMIEVYGRKRTGSGSRASFKRSSEIFERNTRTMKNKNIEVVLEQELSERSDPLYYLKEVRYFKKSDGTHSRSGKEKSHTSQKDPEDQGNQNLDGTNSHAVKEKSQPNQKDPEDQANQNLDGTDSQALKEKSQPSPGDHPEQTNQNSDGTDSQSLEPKIQPFRQGQTNHYSEYEAIEMDVNYQQKLKFTKDDWQTIFDLNVPDNLGSIGRKDLKQILKDKVFQNEGLFQEYDSLKASDALQGRSYNRPIALITTLGILPAAVYIGFATADYEFRKRKVSEFLTYYGQNKP